MKRISILCFILTPFLSIGCYCVGKSSVSEALDNADKVFLGKVLSSKSFIVEEPNLPKGMELRKMEYLFLIKYEYKGFFSKDSIKIITGLGSGDCGIRFKNDKEYIVYATVSDKYFGKGKTVDKFFTTNVCTRTCLSNPKEKKEIIHSKYYSHLNYLSNTLPENLSKVEVPKILTTNPFTVDSKNNYSLTIDSYLDSLTVRVYNKWGNRISSLKFDSINKGDLNVNPSIASFKDSLDLENIVFVIVNYWSNGIEFSENAPTYLSWRAPEENIAETDSLVELKHDSCSISIPRVCGNPFKDGSSDEFSFWSDCNLDSMVITAYEFTGKQIGVMYLDSVSAGSIDAEGLISIYKDATFDQKNVYIIIHYWIDDVDYLEKGVATLFW